MSVCDKLYHILSELEDHKRSKSEAMANAIKLRLEFSLNSYSKSLSDSAQYLETRDDVTILRRLSKE